MHTVRYGGGILRILPPVGAAPSPRKPTFKYPCDHILATNQFKAVVQRPPPHPGNVEKTESKAESLDIRVLTALQNGGPLSKSHIAEALGLRNVTGQLNAQVRALLNRGHIEMTLPEKPNSRLQQYRLTQVGMQMLDTAPKPTA